MHLGREKLWLSSHRFRVCDPARPWALLQAWGWSPCDLLAPVVGVTPVCHTPDRSRGSPSGAQRLGTVLKVTHCSMESTGSQQGLCQWEMLEGSC